VTSVAGRQLEATWDHVDRARRPSLDEALADRGHVVVDGPDVLDPAAIDDHTARLAGALRALGVSHGDTVAWQASNRWEAVILFRAAWRLGAVAAPLHHLAGPSEIDGLLGRLAPKLMVDPDDVAPLIERGPPVRNSVAHGTDLALVLHTSGSSGEPKGVLHTHAGLAVKAQMMAAVHDVGPDDCVLMPAPLAHISGLQNAVTVAGASGMRSVLMSRWDPEHALALIAEHRVTFMMGPPAFFVSLQDTPGFTPERVESIRLISCGGAGVTAAFVEEATEAFGCVVKRTYGSTEAPTITTAHHGDSGPRIAQTDGRPTGSVRVRLGPRDEVWARGPELFVGYTDRDRTVEALGVVDGVEGEWFRTGDIGRIDDDGWLTIVGRIKDIIIRGGENISAAEVEGALVAHPAVRHAVAVGEPHPRLGETVCAFVVLAPGQRFDLATCRAWFESRGLTRFKTPERVEVLDELPLLAAGKPDRAALRRRAAEIGIPPLP